MKIAQFFAANEPPPPPEFVLTKNIAVDTYVWVIGHSPYENKSTKVSIPKGTILIRCSYSNFRDGHSMSFAKPKRGQKNIWFKVKYSDMELVK